MINTYLLRFYLARKRNKQLPSVITYTDPVDGPWTPKKFEFMLDLKDKADKKPYAFYTRMLMQTDTFECPLEVMREIYKNQKKRDLMTKKEMRKFKALPQEITIWRGSENIDEHQPRMSWTLERRVAEKYATQHLFKAVINKKYVVAYYSDNTFEEEIVVFVPKEDVEQIY